MSAKDAFEQRLSDAISHCRIANQRNEELIFDIDIVFRLVDHIDEGMTNGFFGVVPARCPSTDTSQSLQTNRMHTVASRRGPTHLCRTIERVREQFRTGCVRSVRFGQQKRVAFVVLGLLSFDEIPTFNEMSSQISRTSTINKCTNVMPRHAWRRIAIDLILKRLIEIAEVAKEKIGVVFAEPHFRRALQAKLMRGRLDRRVDERAHITVNGSAIAIVDVDFRFVGFVEIGPLSPAALEIQGHATNLVA